jgi:hypothetical protein
MECKICNKKEAIAVCDICNLLLVCEECSIRRGKQIVCKLCKVLEEANTLLKEQKPLAAILSLQCLASENFTAWKQLSKSYQTTINSCMKMLKEEIKSQQPFAYFTAVKMLVSIDNNIKKELQVEIEQLEQQFSDFTDEKEIFQCKVCNTPNYINAKFCKKCGSKL